MTDSSRKTERNLRGLGPATTLCVIIVENSSPF